MVDNNPILALDAVGPSTPTVEDVLHRAARGRAHQRRQRGVAVADHGDRVALPPALIKQRRTQQCMGLLGHAAHQGKAPGGLSVPLHLAADRLKVANLVTGHRTYVGTIEHDNGPARVRRCGLGRIVSDSRDLGCCLPVGRLDPQGDRVGAGAHALLVCRRGRQLPFTSLQNTATASRIGPQWQLVPGEQGARGDREVVAARLAAPSQLARKPTAGIADGAAAARTYRLAVRLGPAQALEHVLHAGVGHAHDLGEAERASAGRKEEMLRPENRSREEKPPSS